MYSESTMNIASDMLSNYQKKDPSNIIKDTIAIFYLCYAILWANHGTEDNIYKYLEESHIGLKDDRHEAVQKLMDLKKLV